MTKTKYLIFDAGPLINFSMNSLLDVLIKLKKTSKIEFLITKEVKSEIIDHPMKIPRFKLGAMRLQDLFNKKIIRHARLTEGEVAELREIRNKITQMANSTFKARGKHIHLIDKGESAALALSVIMKRKTKENIPLVIDERTTRMLCENPENLRKLLSKKLHTKVSANKKNYSEFEGFDIIRSTELAYIAHEKGLTSTKNKELLEAMLYGLKFKGCSISEEEVKTISRM